MSNNKSDATYHDPKRSQTDATPEPAAPKRAELGQVGRWVFGIVSLAIVTPFIAILWAWAIGVVNTFLNR